MPRSIISEVAGQYREYDDGTILILNAIASYPHVGSKSDFTDAKTGKVSSRWGVKGLLPKATHRKAKECISNRINALIEENKAAFKKGEKVMLPPDLKFLTDGDKSNKTENEGMFVLSCSESKNRPSARNRKGQSITPDEADELFYGGCIVNILIRPWFQNNKEYGKRVNANFVAIQFVKDGTPFGEGRISEEELDDTFDAIDDDDDAGFDDDSGLDDDDDL